MRTARAGDPQLEPWPAASASAVGRGGMLTKVLAAKRAARSGASTVIACGSEERVLLRLAAGEAVGTSLIAPETSLGARKQWLADHVQLAGRLTLDRRRRARACARRQEPAADRRGRASTASSSAARSSAASTPTAGDRARSRQLRRTGDPRILRRPSSEIEAILGYVDEPELIHRDNLVLLG